mmetsp:Transcript_1188/g.7776  ORF Transcript_1188/g.7776 Transcript_1188/m.7776 type:complete len:180 (+) Transcript_1188:223-762(+)
MGRWDEVRLGGHGRGGTVGRWEKTSSWDTRDVRRHTRKRDVQDVVDGRTKERMKSTVDGLVARKLERATSCSATRNTSGGTPRDHHNVDAKNGVDKAYDIERKHTTRRTNERSDARGPVGQGCVKANGEEVGEKQHASVQNRSLTHANATRRDECHGRMNDCPPKTLRLVRTSTGGLLL